MVSTQKYPVSMQKLLISFAVSILIIPMCILADNCIDLVPFLKSGTGSVYYFFFGSIAYGGLFGVYITPMLCVPPQKYYVELKDNRSQFAKRFFGSCVYGGLVLSSGYMLLFLLLKIRMPMIMVTEMDRILDSASVAQSLPYDKYFLAKQGWKYFASAICMGFLSGSLFAGIATTVSAFTYSYGLIKASPFVGYIALIYGSKYLNIPDAYRLDRWIKMQNVFINEELTLFLSTLVITIIVLVLYRICVLKINNLKPHESSACDEKWRNQRIMPSIKWRFIMVSVFVLLMVNFYMWPVCQYANQFSAKITPFSYPLITSESFFVMVYMSGILTLFCDLPRKQEYIVGRKSLTMDIVKDVLVISSAYIITGMIISIVVCLPHALCSIEWGNVWMSLAINGSLGAGGLQFPVPLYFLQEYTPLCGLLISVLLIMGCSSFLGFVCALGNVIHNGLGPIIALIFILLDVSAYNLGLDYLYAISPVTLAQCATFYKGRNSVGLSLPYCFIFFIVGSLVYILLLWSINTVKAGFNKGRMCKLHG